MTAYDKAEGAAKNRDRRITQSLPSSSNFDIPVETDIVWREDLRLGCDV